MCCCVADREYQVEIEENKRLKLMSAPDRKKASKLIGSVDGLLEFGAPHMFQPLPKPLFGLELKAQQDELAANVTRDTQGNIKVSAADLVKKVEKVFLASIKGTITDQVPAKPNKTTLAVEEKKKAVTGKKAFIQDPLQLPRLEAMKPGVFGTVEGTISGRMERELANAMLSITLEQSMEKAAVVGQLLCVQA